eukprot:COSAG06_NODE_3292_length_5547_cov_22.916483_4_plen_46_part_00
MRDWAAAYYTMLNTVFYPYEHSTAYYKLHLLLLLYYVKYTNLVLQ